MRKRPGVALPEGQAGGDEAALGQRLLGRQDRRQVPVLDHDQPGGGDRLLPRLGGDRHHRLTGILDLVDRQHRIARQHRADIDLPRHVGGGQHRMHAGGGFGGRRIQPQDPGMRLGRQQDGGVQRTRQLRQVVGIDRLPGDVLVGAVMGQRHADPALGPGRSGHAAAVKHGSPPPVGRPGRWFRDRSASTGCGRSGTGTRHSPACR